MKRVWEAVVIGGLIAGGVSNVHAAVIHVPDDTPNIQQAVDDAAPGDTVLIGRGIFQQTFHVAEKELTIASHFLTTRDSSQIRATILHGGGIDNQAAVLSVSGTEMVTVVGLTFTSSDDGISASSPMNISHCHIYGNGDGIDFEAGGGGEVSHCLIERNVDDAIDLDDNNQLLVSACILRDNDDDGIEVRMQPWDGEALHIAVKNSVISGNGEDGVQLIGYNETTRRRITLFNNLIADNEIAAVACMDDSTTREDYRGAQLPERVEIINNTFVNNPYGVVGGAGMSIRDNKFVGCSAAALRRVGGNSELEGNMAWECTFLDDEMESAKDGFRFIIPPGNGRPGVQSQLRPGVDAAKKLRWISPTPGGE